MERIVSVLIGYAFGLFQTGYLYGKAQHIDIREHGSGNSGTTNALRTLGWKAGAITFLGDCLKCILAVVVVRLIYGTDHEAITLLSMYAGAGAVLGHNFPFYLKFKGGKGIAATAGLIIATNPVMTITLLLLFVGILLLTRYVSLGSLCVMVCFLIEVIVYGQNGGFHLEGALLYELYGVVAFLMVMAFVRHRANIKRLLNGTENKFGTKKK
ncbi:MAG: glycerol-3-phosphate 1-O-acyltransferase PlsY [Faecalimonas sp.]|nr:glycerol-3-phosphate 1-O-acyltransferase PlsY [Faecalimonas sp.]